MCRQGERESGGRSDARSSGAGGAQVYGGTEESIRGESCHQASGEEECTEAKAICAEAFFRHGHGVTAFA